MAEIAYEQDNEHFRNSTLGTWDDEKEAERVFEKIIMESGCFDIWRQVTSKSIDWVPHFRTEKTRCRPDFVLKPKQKLIDAGWDCDGWIVVECKPSKTAIGPMINQLIDYMHCTFEVNGIEFKPSWGFAWPVAKQACAIASVMAHQRVGSVHANGLMPNYRFNDNYDHASLLHFHCGESRLATVGAKEVTTIKNNFRIGRKTGSR